MYIENAVYKYQCYHYHNINFSFFVSFFFYKYIC